MQQDHPFLNSAMRLSNLVPKDGDVFYIPNFFSGAEADGCFSSLQDDVQWRQTPIKMFGKDILQPRLTSWIGDDGAAYRYSGVTLRPEPWPMILKDIKQRVESVVGVVFNSALLNLYRNGQDSMGWHRDNEKELGACPVISSVSFGAERLFRLRHYFEKKLETEILLAHGSLLIMCGQTQHFWEHSIPKTSKSAWESTNPRINVTFRLVHI